MKPGLVPGLLFWEASLQIRLGWQTVCAENLSAVAPAATVGADMITSRTGMRGGVGIILSASSIGTAMKSPPASAGNLDDVGVRRRERRERHRVGGTRSDQSAEEKSCSYQSIHKSFSIGSVG